MVSYSYQEWWSRNLKILTCNIRTALADDGADNWALRKAFCIEVMLSRHPDIICFQEMTLAQFGDLRDAFPEWTWTGMADRATSLDPYNAIFYREPAYARISTGGYWLSETPHVTGSSSWDSAYPRLANWVRLKDRTTGTEFRVINTHLDHISQPARDHQARLIAEDASAYPDDYLQILAGDMNCDSRNKAIDAFKAGGWTDTYGLVHGTEDPGFTYHEFTGPDYVSDVGKMDWIFVRGRTRVVNAEIITDSQAGRFPSDHYFVSASLAVEAG